MSEIQFEALTKDPEKPWILYERYKKDNKSFIRKINHDSFFFVECNPKDPDAKYTDFFNRSKKYKKVHTKFGSQYKDQKNCKPFSTESSYLRDINYSFNKNPRVFYLDIETTAKNKIDTNICPEEIVSIQIYVNDINTNIIISSSDFDYQKYMTKDGYYKFDKEYNFKLKYLKVNSETELLETYFKVVKGLQPLIVYAWNGEGFDFAYLWKRAKRLGFENPRFGPFEETGASKFSANELDNGTIFYRIKSNTCFYMDYLDIYKKYTFTPRQSYALDAIAEVELNERKVNHDCFKTFDGFRTGEGYLRPLECPSEESKLEFALYNAKSDSEIKKISQEWFIHYSIIDTYLLFKLDNKLKLTNLMMTTAEMMRLNIDSVRGTIMPWTNYIKNKLYEKNIIINDSEIPKYDPDNVTGGFVMEPKTGLYKDYIFSCDVSSMYPSQMVAFNLSPETYVPHHKRPLDLQDEINKLELDKDEQKHIKNYFENPEKYKKYSELLEKYNFSGTMNGAIFEKSEIGIIPELVREIYFGRKEAKKEMQKYQSNIELILEELKNRH